MAFLSSRIQETESKLLVPLGQGWNLGGWGLNAVDFRGVFGLAEKLVCSFKLLADVVWGGVR